MLCKLCPGPMQTLAMTSSPQVGWYCWYCWYCWLGLSSWACAHSVYAAASRPAQLLTHCVRIEHAAASGQPLALWETAAAAMCRTTCYTLPCWQAFHHPVRCPPLHRVLRRSSWCLSTRTCSSSTERWHSSRPRVSEHWSIGGWVDEQCPLISLPAVCQPPPTLLPLVCSLHAVLPAASAAGVGG